MLQHQITDRLYETFVELNKQFRKGLGEPGLRLVLGADGVWVSTFEIQQDDKSWLQVMEFRMRRVKG